LTTLVRLEQDGASLDITLVPWDSEVFGFAVAQVEQLDLGRAETLSALAPELDRWCDDHDVGLISCRLDHLRLRESAALEALGFRFIETVYHPRLATLEDAVSPRQMVHVSEASKGDLPAIEAIASLAFTTGRFLLDGRLDPALSDRRYANWVRTSFANDGHTVLKAEVGGDLVGFFIVERRSDGGVYWHLTAMAPAWQGQGLGLSVWQTMLLRHRTEGATSVETTISGHNLPAINLYAQLGFAFASAQMTFHRLRAPSE
jgi:RimJ/RimL family protein N-acetyltransferase